MAKAQSSGDTTRILRIGIQQSQKIVEERLVRKRVPVTIGQSAKNTFMVPSSNTLPKMFTLFDVGADGYSLNFQQGMDGRVSLGDGEPVVTLSNAQNSGAQKKGDVWQLKLNDKSRGKVVIGDVTVLFQFVVPPPVQPRPQLPASVRSSLLQNLDWMLVSVMAVSFLIHLGFIVYLRTIDISKKPDIEEIPDRFVKMIVPQKKEEKKEVKKEDPNAKEKKPAEKKPAAKPDKVAAAVANLKKDPEAFAKAEAERKAALAAKVNSMGVLKLLGAKSGDGEGAIADLVKGGDVSGDADKVFAAVGGVGVAGAGSGGLQSAKGTTGSGSLRGGGSLKAGQIGEVGTGGPAAEHVVHGTVKDSAPTDVDGSLDANVIAKEIKARLGGVRACYEAGLKRNPSISGKLVLRFEVSTIGKVTSAEVDSDTLHDDEVASCIKGKMMSIRFPAPAGGSVQFSYPFVFQSSK